MNPSRQRSRTAILLVSLLTGLLFYLASLVVFGGTHMESSATGPLTLQFSISLPDVVTSRGFKIKDPPAQVKWSPDNNYVAIFGFTSSKLFLLDVNQQQLIDPNIHFRGAPPNIAWSADSSLLALNNVNVGLFRVADGKELGRRDNFRYGRCSTQPRQAGAFTADGRFLWVSCGPRGEQGSYRAAEKLAIPDLKIVDSVDADGIDPENQGFTYSDRIVVEGGRILLSSIFQSCSKSGRYKPLNCQPYAACLDLESKRHCFPSIALEQSTGARGLSDIQLVPNSPRLISFWTWGQEAPSGPDWMFEAYDFTGNWVRQFGARTEYENVPPREFVVTKECLVISSAGYLDGKSGRLLVWDANTGQLLQRMTTPFASDIAVSPDGQRLAAHVGLEIRVYSISKV
jgi:hypothetical protein